MLTLHAFLLTFFPFVGFLPVLRLIVSLFLPASFLPVLGFGVLLLAILAFGLPLLPVLVGALSGLLPLLVLRLALLLLIPLLAVFLLLVLLVLILWILRRVLLLLLLLQFIELPLHQVPVEAGILIRGIQRQRVVIRLECFFPGLDRLLRILARSHLPHAVKRITKVIVGLLLDLQIGRRQRSLELVNRFLELAPRVGFRPPVVVRHPARLARHRGNPPRQQQHRRRPHPPRHGSQRLALPLPPPLAHHRLQREEGNRQAQRPLESLQRDLLHLLRQLALRSQRQALLIDRVQALRPAPQGHIQSAGRARDFSQRRGIQLGLHHLALFIL